MSFLSLALIALLIPTALSTPILYPRQSNSTNSSSAAAKNVANTTVPAINTTISIIGDYNSNLPNVTIFATGGTIAGSSSSATDTTGYAAGVLGVATLVQAVPQLKNVSNIYGAQIVNIASENMISEVVIAMAKKANEILCGEGSTTAGVVITHGTDTMEETAFYMDSLISCDKPVILVGSMRPSTAISADGPSNLLQAVTLAAHPEAKGRGAMIVLNDRIGQALYTWKTNANTMNTFFAHEQGTLGGFLSAKPFFYYPAVQPSFKHTFDVSKIDSVPKVDILYGHQEFDWQLINSAIANGAKGVILAAAGAGSVTTPSLPAVAAALKNGIPIVAATKIIEGAAPLGESDWIHAGFLSPVKSRIRLQLALASGMGYEETRETFEGVLKKFMA